MNHSLHSDEYNRRKENFEISLTELDKKHNEYFKSRPPVLLSQKYDSIINHFMILNTLERPALNITSIELPQEIKDDLLNLFHQHWD